MQRTPAQLCAGCPTLAAVKNLTSRDNPRLKQLRRWAAQGRARREDGVILLDGLHLIDALLATGREVEELVVSESGLRKPEISAWLIAHGGLNAVRTPDALFAEIAVTETPSGILGVARALPPMHGIANDRDCILLDGVQDPGNVGTLLRTAAAAGITQAVLGPSCADAWAPKTLRAGQGAQFELAIHESSDLPTVLAAYGGTSVVTRLDASASLFETALEGPIAWVFGAEGQGVSAPVSAAADLGIHIPMPGRMESLNVAAAAAICLFEMVRRRS